MMRKLHDKNSRLDKKYQQTASAGMFMVSCDVVSSSQIIMIPIRKVRSQSKGKVVLHKTDSRPFISLCCQSGT